MTEVALKQVMYQGLAYLHACLCNEILKAFEDRRLHRSRVAALLPFPRDLAGMIADYASWDYQELADHTALFRPYELLGIDASHDAFSRLEARVRPYLARGIGTQRGDAFPTDVVTLVRRLSLDFVFPPYVVGLYSWEGGQSHFMTLLYRYISRRGDAAAIASGIDDLRRWKDNTPQKVLDEALASQSNLVPTRRGEISLKNVPPMPKTRQKFYCFNRREFFEVQVQRRGLLKIFPSWMVLNLADPDLMY